MDFLFALVFFFSLSLHSWRDDHKRQTWRAGARAVCIAVGVLIRALLNSGALGLNIAQVTVFQTISLPKCTSSGSDKILAESTYREFGKIWILPSSKNRNHDMGPGQGWYLVLSPAGRPCFSLVQKKTQI